VATSIRDIKVLKGLEPVRKSPGMYIGNVHSREGVFNYLREVIDNAIDEFSEGKNSIVKIVIDTKRNTAVIGDQALGIPVEIHPQTKLSGLTTILTRLHAGAKFDKTKSYKRGSGTHGVGVSVTNALSKLFEVWTYRKRQWYYQAFKKGKPLSRNPKKVHKSKVPLRNWKRGTVVRCTPDESVFTYSKLPVSSVVSWIKNDAQYLCAGLRFEVVIDGKEESFYIKEGGLKAMLDALAARDKLNFVGKPFYFLSKDKSIESAFGWTNTTEPSYSIRGYANHNYTKDGGTHVTEFKQAIVTAFKAVDKKARKLSSDDLLAGLYGVISIYDPNALYVGQTKDKLGSDVKFKDILVPEIKMFLSKNKNLVTKIINKAVKLKAARERFKKEVENAKIEAKLSRTGKIILPPKFVSASPSIKPHEREMFIVEGDSAMGTLRKVVGKHQELLPIRGKITNVFKAAPIKVLRNPDVTNIITCVGCGITKACDPDKARVGRVLLLPDSDEDGFHIAALLTSFFYKYMRPLYKAKMLYYVKAPLFAASVGTKKYFGYTHADLMREIPKSKHKSAIITRMKGWGGASKEAMRRFACDPETRTLYRPIIRDYEKMDIYLEQIMGNETTLRKKLLGV